MSILNKLKQANIICFHRESKKGYFVVEHKLSHFVFEDLEIEDIKYILENGTEVRFEYDIVSKIGDIFKYTIHNGGSYEFSSSVSLYSKQYFTGEEFNEMIKEAIIKSQEEGSIPREPLTVRKVIRELNPNVFIDIAMGTGGCTCSWNCGECDNPLR